MPNNDLINIANVLTERLSNNQPTNLANMVLDKQGKKELNHEVMFYLLMGLCEKHILENAGNQVVDDFKNDLLQKFSGLVQILHNND